MSSPTTHGTIPRDDPPQDFTSLPRTTPTSSHNPYQRPKHTTQPLPTTRQTKLPDFESNTILDNFPYGDPVNLKDPTHYRHIGGNVNGISSTQRFHEATELAMLADTFQADGASFIETNVDFTYQGAAHQIRSKLRPAWNNVINMTYTNSTRTFGNYYQPGGVCQLIGGSWTRRVTSTTSDTSGLGQWTCQTLTGSPGRNLSIITAYQTCTGHQALGEKTSWKQRQSLLTAMNRNGETTVTEPRQYFLESLSSLVTSLSEKGHGILVFIDANSHLNDQRSWLHKFLDRTLLRDVYEHRHGFDNEPATYQRGTHRIDFMFASSDVLPYISACGYTSFLSHSDHRTMFCDIQLPQYLRDKAPPEDISSKSRYIFSKYKKMSKQYKEQTLRQLTAANYHATLSQLYNDVQTTRSLTPTQQQTLEKVDSLITSVMVDTEKDMRRKHINAWSPKLHQASQALAYWKSWIKELNTKRDLSRQREKFLESIPDRGMYPSTTPTLSQAKKMYRRSLTSLNEIRKNADRIREEWLLEQEDIARSEGSISRARRLRNIRNSEAATRSFNSIRIAIHGVTGGALKTLLVPSPDATEPVRVTDPVAIIEHLIERNLKHFNQAHGTLFTSRHLQTICSYTFSEAIEQLEAITGQGIEVFDAIVKALSTKVAPTDLNAGLITGDDISQKFRKWKESTSTSPSGRHLGQYRAIRKGANPVFQSAHLTPYEHIMNSTDDTPPEPDHGNIFYECIATIINICVTTGYPLQRWRQINNVMLEKLPGMPLLDKLRVIHIFEADFNAWAGIVFGRRMMQKAEMADFLGNEQGGSRKGRTAIDVYAMKFFSFQISEVTRTPLAVMDNDAKACYDRIVMALAHMRCQQIGMPHDACRLLDNFLNNAEYHIQTQLGVAEKSYRSTPDHKLHGPGQGSQCSPAIWAVLSTLILGAVRSKSPGTYFCDPSRAIEVSHYMQSFVDDSSIWVNDFINSLQQQTPGHHLANTLQTATQWWEELLVATGGKLELPKCFFYMIEWKYTTNKTRPYTASERSYEISITQSTDNTIERLQQKSADIAHRTLGFQAKPSNDFREQLEVLRKSSANLTRAIRSHHFDASTAQRSYYSVFIPRMLYPLHLCGLSDKQLRTVQSGPLNATLQSLGYPATFPRQMVFGNKNEGGLGFTPLYIEQGILNTTFILRHLRQDHQLGQIILIHLQWLQHFSGVGFPLLRYPKRQTVQLPSTWFTEYRSFLSAIDGHMDLTSDRQLPLYRQNDVFIMEAAATVVNATDLFHINVVRIFLQVSRLSDICNVAGTKLISTKGINSLLPTSFPSRSLELWPIQPQPNPLSWQAWRRLMAFFTRDGKTLRTPLRPWIPQVFQRQWPIMYDSDSDHIFKLNRKHWEVYPITTTIRRKHVIPLHPIDIDHELPPHSIPSESSNKPFHIIIPPFHEAHYPTKPTASTLDEMLQSLDPWEADLLRYHQPLLAPQSLLDALVRPAQQLYLVSDGGHKGLHGSFGWVIATTDTIIWEGWGTAHGGPMSSYRAEAYGRLAGCRFLIRYMEYLGLPYIQDTHLITATDNQELLRNETRWKNNKIPNPYFHLSPDVDMIELLVQSWSQVQFSLSHHHVKGHQDDHTPVSELPWMAQLNIHADSLATYALDLLMNPPNSNAPRPPSNARFYMNGLLITSKYPATIKKQAGKGILFNYLSKQTDYDLTAVNWISWNTARSRLPLRKQAFVTKLLCNWLTTNERAARLNPTQPAGCPHCTKPVETCDHILCCTSNAQWRDTFQAELHEWHLVQNSPATLVDLLRHELHKWFLDPQPTLLIAEQFPVSFLFRGCIPNVWTTLVDNHLKQLSTFSHTNNGTQWSTDLGHFIMKQTHKAWKHRSSLHIQNTMTAHALQERQQMKQDITRLYALQSQCIIQYPFTMRLQSRLQLPNDALAAWLTNNRTNIQESHNAWITRNPLRQRDIRSFFHRRQYTTHQPP